LRRGSSLGDEYVGARVLGLREKLLEKFAKEIGNVSIR